MHKGIDVSGSAQGFPDFHSVAKAGYRFTYIKATEGVGFTDPGYERRQRDARQANLHTGFYHFLRPRTGRNGKVEAESFYRAVRGIARGTGRGSKLLRLALDVEVTALNQEATREYTRDCLDRLKQLCEHEPIIYTFPSFLGFWGSELSNYPLWIANFDVAKPKLPQGFDKWTIWQHTSKGRVPGVRGLVDLNKAPRLSSLILDRHSY